MKGMGVLAIRSKVLKAVLKSSTYVHAADELSLNCLAATLTLASNIGSTPSVIKPLSHASARVSRIIVSMSAGRTAAGLTSEWLACRV